jgi:hypothetical protein
MGTFKKRNLPIFLLYFILCSFLFVSSSSVFGTYFFGEEDYQAKTISEENGNNEMGFTFASASFVLPTGNWINSNYQKKCREIGASWPISEESNYSFLYTSLTADFGVSIGKNDTKKVRTAVFGIPSVSLTGGKFGFSLKSGEWFSGLGSDSFYISENLANSLALQVGDSCVLKTSSKANSLKVYGVCSNSSFSLIDRLLGDTFIILPYASSYDCAGHSGAASFCCSLSNDRYQNMITMEVINSFRESSDLSVSFFSNDFGNPNLDFEKKMNGYKDLVSARKSVTIFFGLASLCLVLPGALICVKRYFQYQKLLVASSCFCILVSIFCRLLFSFLSFADAIFEITSPAGFVSGIVVMLIPLLASFFCSRRKAVL